jgi:branched-subunit amino acid aminotransferase/4-amino-4-deoxychorismate lyase
MSDELKPLLTHHSSLITHHSPLHSRIIYNHRLLDASRARMNVISPVSLYGRGVFTTLAIHEGRPFLWPEHWARLTGHAARAGVDRSELDEESVSASLAQLIEANRVKQGRARITLLANVERGIWKVKEAGTRQTDLLMMTGGVHAASEDGLALTVSPFRVNTLSPLAGVKSVNYLEHILAWEEAHGRDFDEAVRLNERGEVVSATMANLFWITDGTLHTPALATGALAGTTRACVLELAGEISVPHVEGVYELSDVGDADEIFLTSAGHGLRIVTTFDFHRYTVPVGSIALRLHEAFRQLMLRA